MTRVFCTRAPFLGWLAASLAIAGCGGQATTATTASSGSSGAGSITAPADGSATVAFETASQVIAMSAGKLVLNVLRSGDLSAAVSVQYSTHDGSAVAGTDYVASSGSVSFQAGDDGAKSITVVVNSVASTVNREFTVTLESPVGATLGSPAVAMIAIDRSGTTPVSQSGSIAWSTAAFSVAQSAGSVSLSVARSGGAAGAASIKYATADGSAAAGAQYTAASGTLAWADGDTAMKSVTIPVSAAAFTGSKTFTVALSAVTGAVAGTPSTAAVTIIGSGTASAAGGTGPAATLAVKLGLPLRLAIGLGAQGDGDSVAMVHSQNLKVDIHERYFGAGDWTQFNAAPCDYVCVVTKAADALGAVPMLTQYQMANSGDGNLAVISDATFMNTYWARLKQLYQGIATFGKPVLVNLEPDFWGYTERSSGQDPSKLAALVTQNPDCATLSNDVRGIAQCMLAMARKYAPKAYLGFPPSNFGGDSDAQVIAFMSALGAQNGDFIVAQTLDRDVGCFEATPAPSYCARSAANLYWDESNKTHPNFQDHLTQVSNYHLAIGNLPVIWWQTPLGVPSSTPAGTAMHYRDNRVHYFLTHARELVAAGGLGVVFSTGETHQTNISTDGGQFQSLSSQYLAAPTTLP